MNDRKRRVRKVLLIFLGSIACVLLASWLWVESVASRQWKEARLRVEGLREEVTKRQPRPGEPGSPSAWADYDIALQLIWEASSEEAAGIGPRVLEKLQQGAHRDRSSDFLSASRFATYDITYFGQIPAGMRGIVISNSRKLMNEGKLREAVDLLLDFLRFTFDLWACGMRSVERCSFEISLGPLEELHLAIVEGKLGALELEHLESELSALEKRIPPYLLVDLQDVVRFGDVLLSEQEFPLWLSHNKDLRHWRYLYSPRIMKAAALRDAEESIRKALLSERASYADAKRAFKEIYDGHRSQNPLSSAWVSEHSTGMERQRLAELRLLRIAAHYRRTGNVLGLADPFGDNLKHSESGGRLKAWSIGQEQAPNFVISHRRRVKTPPLTIEVGHEE